MDHPLTLSAGAFKAGLSQSEKSLGLVVSNRYKTVTVVDDRTARSTPVNAWLQIFEGGVRNCRSLSPDDGLWWFWISSAHPEMDGH
jgi:hypothetical protein